MIDYMITSIRLDFLTRLLLLLLFFLILFIIFFEGGKVSRNIINYNVNINNIRFY